MTLIEQASLRLASPSPRPVPDAGGLDDSRRRSPHVEIDLELLERSGHLVPALDKSAMAEEFRRVKRALLRNVGRDGDGASRRNALIMVTSAIEGEGKTFCAINLAMSIAMEIDSSVLLVDANVRRPAALERMGVTPPEVGWLDALADPSHALAELILRTSVPKLSLLPLGTRSGRSGERLASGAMQSLLSDIAGRYADRIVVFDGPPVLQESCAATLAEGVGQVLMVVAARATPRVAVSRAFAELGHCTQLVSMLNRCSSRVVARSVGYQQPPPPSRGGPGATLIVKRPPAA